MKKRTGKISDLIRECVMVGFIFTLCLLSILALVGFLFAWMVRMASFPEEQSADESHQSFEMIEPSATPAKVKQ